MKQHHCPICKLMVPEGDAIAAFCTEPNCPQFVSNNLEVFNVEDLYPSFMSQKECPICEHRLAVACVGQSYVVWCGYGACPSGAAEQGAEGPTEDAAIDKLHRLIEVEVGQNNRHGAMCGCPCCMDLTLVEWKERE